MKASAKGKNEAFITKHYRGVMMNFCSILLILQVTYVCGTYMRYAATKALARRAKKDPEAAKTVKSNLSSFF